MQKISSLITRVKIDYCSLFVKFHNVLKLLLKNVLFEIFEPFKPKCEQRFSKFFLSNHLLEQLKAIIVIYSNSNTYIVRN